MDTRSQSHVGKQPLQIRPPVPTDLTPHLSALTELAAAYDIDLIVLFGSRAQGHANKESDYDLGILLSDPVIGTDRLRELARDVQRILNTGRVDIVVLNRASALLQYQVARTGIPLVERCQGTFATFCLRSLQRHNDSRDFYVAKDIYLRRRFGLASVSGPKSEGDPDG